MKTNMKYIKLWEDHGKRWSWPEYARLIELGLIKPDLFQAYTRIPFLEGETLDKKETLAELEAAASQFGVQCQGSNDPGRFSQGRLEFLWVGPVEGLKVFVDEVRKRFPPWDRVLVRNWIRVHEKWNKFEEQYWYSWFNKHRGVEPLEESVDAAGRLTRLIDLGLVDPNEVGVKGLVVALFSERYPELVFEWSSRSALRLKVSRLDGTEPSYLERSAANRQQYTLVGAWIWKSWNREFYEINLNMFMLSDDRQLRQAVDIYRQSVPFLDHVYGDNKKEQEQDQ